MISLFVPLAVLFGMSLLVLSSIAMHFFWLQLLWIAIAGAFVALFFILDWRPLLRHPWFIYGLYSLSILLLIAVLLFGPVIRNVRGWIVIGPLTYQPVELAKIALILVYALYFSRRHLSIARFRTILISLAIAIPPIGLTMLQPDLGSALVLAGIWFGFLLVSGLPLRRILLAVAVFSIGAFIMWNYMLQGYQKARILGVLYPERDTLGVNYSVNQAKIAIGSAGAWGKGYAQGTQTQLGFLTEPEGDFVLAALIEEWGWVVGVLAILALFALIVGILRIGARAEQNVEKFICVGVALMLGLQFFLNSGSTTGLVPVIGITFPFLSYGGSSMLTNVLLVGIVRSIHARA